MNVCIIIASPWLIKAWLRGSNSNADEIYVEKNKPNKISSAMLSIYWRNLIIPIVNRKNDRKLYSCFCNWALKGYINTLYMICLCQVHMLANTAANKNNVWSFTLTSVADVYPHDSLVMECVSYLLLSKDWEYLSSLHDTRVAFTEVRRS